MRNILHIKESDEMRVFLTGDTHGILDIGKLSEKNFPLQRSLTKEDYLVVLGDLAVYGSVMRRMDINIFRTDTFRIPS